LSVGKLERPALTILTHDAGSRSGYNVLSCDVTLRLGGDQFLYYGDFYSDDNVSKWL